MKAVLRNVLGFSTDYRDLAVGVLIANDMVFQADATWDRPYQTN